jgi:hypothetical protein
MRIGLDLAAAPGYWDLFVFPTRRRVLSVSLTGLLATASPGPTPSLENLRADFRCAIQADLDQTVVARIRSRYPVPLLTNDTTVRT